MDEIKLEKPVEEPIEGDHPEDPWEGYDPTDEDLTEQAAERDAREWNEESAAGAYESLEASYEEEVAPTTEEKVPETEKNQNLDEEMAFLEYEPDCWRGQNLVVNERYRLPRWVVEGVFRRRTLLFIPGAAGAGKTAWAIDTAHAIQSGAQMDSAGRKIVTSGEVLLISQDTFKADVIEMVRRRGANFHIWPRLNVRLVTMGGKNQYDVRKDVENFDRVVEHCKILRDAGSPVVVIILDSLATIARVNLNDNIVASQVMDIIRELSERTNTGIMIIHHPTKEDFKTGKSAMLSGGYQLEAGSDFIQYIQPVKGGEFPGGKKLIIKMHRGRAADMAPDVVMNYIYREEDGTPVMRFTRLVESATEVELPELPKACEWTDIEGPKTATEIGKHLWPMMKSRAAAEKFRRRISPHMLLVEMDGEPKKYQRASGVMVTDPEEPVCGPGKRERAESS